MRLAHARLAFVVVMGAIALGGCPEDRPRGADGGPPPADGGGQSLDCVGVLGCAQGCDDGDEPCTDACVARADATALARLRALVECVSREGCGEDDACIESRCGAEVAACAGGALPDGGVTSDGGADALPIAIEGTMIDRTTHDTDSYVLESSSTVRFVRDDAAGEAAGYPSSTHAFYRIEQIEYRAVASGTLLTCSHAADQVTAFSDPDPQQNHLRVARATDAGGLREYTLITTLERTIAGALHLECDPGGASTEDFDADHAMANGTSAPRGDGWTFRDTASVRSSVSTRTWTWDLTGR